MVVIVVIVVTTVTTVMMVMIFLDPADAQIRRQPDQIIDFGYQNRNGKGGGAWKERRRSFQGEG